MEVAGEYFANAALFQTQDYVQDCSVSGAVGGCAQEFSFGQVREKGATNSQPAGQAECRGNIKRISKGNPRQEKTLLCFYAHRIIMRSRMMIREP